MKKSYVLIPALMVVLMSSFTIRETTAIAEFGVTSSEEVVTQLDQKKLVIDNIKLNVAKKPPKIDRKAAADIAQQAFPELVAGAKDVHIEYHQITNDSFQMFSNEALDKNPDLKAKGHMDELPAYIITFKGVQTSTHSPSGVTPTKVHTEVNVIVDAMTGEVLMAFSHS